MQKTEQFSSRWGLLMAAIGMAVGTGNIWRFPRMVAQNGGGAFLVPWMVFLFLWSIPLLMVEMAMGRATRQGTVGAFGRIMGRNYVWLGCFVGFVTMAITFYYSVVTGWCVKFFWGAVTGEVFVEGGHAYWDSFQASGWQPLLFHGVAMLLAGGVVYRGVVGGIERVTKLLIPLLFVLLVGGAVRALTLPGAVDGLNYLFDIDPVLLLDYRLWLEGLTQSAWSTGAGWGLMLTYAIYTSKRDDIVGNSVTIAFGDNSASLLAAILVLGSVFALAPAQGMDVPQIEQILREGGTGNTALSFFWMPALFQQMPLGQLALALFFFCLVIAAVSSLIAQVELCTRIFMDAGLTRHRAVLFVSVSCFVFGIPSAISLSIFSNQDTVWGIGLMVSGFLFTLAVRKFGVSRFREEFIEPADNDYPIGRWFDVLIKYVLPVEFVAMCGWWLYQATISDPNWWNPFAVFSLGTCLFQWGIAFLLFRLLNDRIAAATLDRPQEAA